MSKLSNLFQGIEIFFYNCGFLDVFLIQIFTQIISFQNMVLWDFIEEREHRLELLRGSIQTLLLELELEDLADDFYFADDTVSESSDL